MSDQTKQVTVQCSCGCGFLKLEKYNWGTGYSEGVEYDISFYKREYYNGEYSLLRSLFRRVKHAWFTLLGKEYCLFEICLSKEQFEDFRSGLEEL